MACWARVRASRNGFTAGTLADVGGYGNEASLLCTAVPLQVAAGGRQHPW
jgi:hypothetical protein